MRLDVNYICRARELKQDQLQISNRFNADHPYRVVGIAHSDSTAVALAVLVSGLQRRPPQHDQDGSPKLDNLADGTASICGSRPWACVSASKSA